MPTEELTLEQRVEKIEHALEILADTEAHRLRSVKETFEKLIAFLHPEKAVSITTSVVAPPVEEPTGPVKPPTHGKGSSTDEWRAYAESLGIEVGPDATKTAIIEGVERFEQQEADTPKE